MCKNVKGVREIEILVEERIPRRVFVGDLAGRVNKKFSMQGGSASASSSEVLAGLIGVHNLRREGLEKGSKADLENGSKGDLEKGPDSPGRHNPLSSAAGGSVEAQNLRGSSVGAILHSGKDSKCQGPNAPSRVVGGESGEGACDDPSLAVLGFKPHPPKS